EAAFSADAKPVISSRVAHDAYGIDFTPTTDGNLPTHKFKTLSVDGLTIANPEFAIYRDDSGGCNGGARMQAQKLRSEHDPIIERCFGLPDMTIGLPELKRLHVYIAFRERMVYVTAADAS